QLIAAGRAPGLTIAFQSTNLVFDWILSGLLTLAGAAAAQRIAVSLAVLVFVWGGFAFVSAASGTRPWPILPLIAILAYGWVFQMGFFNFYLSLGLCFWAMSLVWKGTSRAAAGAAALFALAWPAHNLPVVWGVWIIGYAWLVARWNPRRRFLLI